jgi:hypothetical protein
VVAPNATSVENDWTRVPSVGAVPPGPPAIGHVVAPCAFVWSGLAALVAVVPRPPPNWPTITSEVGTVFVPVAVGKDRLFLRLIVRAWPVGTVITTGDHVAAVVDAGFNATQVAVAPATTAPQL